jgi:hypothetical protein
MIPESPDPFDSLFYSVYCPTCGEEFKQPFTWFERNSEFCCAKCATAIVFRAKEFAAALQQMREGLAILNITVTERR